MTKVFTSTVFLMFVSLPSFFPLKHSSLKCSGTYFLETFTSVLPKASNENTKEHRMGLF